MANKSIEKVLRLKQQKMICLHTWSRETSKYDMKSIVRVPLRASGSSEILQSSNSQDVKHSSEIFASLPPCLSATFLRAIATYLWAADCFVLS